jgi:hypothetical protein
LDRQIFKFLIFYQMRTISFTPENEILHQVEPQDAVDREIFVVESALDVWIQGPSAGQTRQLPSEKCL